MDKISVENLKMCYAKPDVLLFAFQVALIFIVVCVSLLNLTLEWGNLNLWTVILTGSLGYIMPNPKLKAGIEKLELEEETLKRNA